MTVTDSLPLRTLYPPPHAQAGLNVLAVVREGRSLARPSASSRRAGLLQLENHYCNQVLQARRAWRGSGHRQETVRKLAPQAG